jgi:hypothetical protein
MVVVLRVAWQSVAKVEFPPIPAEPAGMHCLTQRVTQPGSSWTYTWMSTVDCDHCCNYPLKEGPKGTFWNVPE